MTMFLVGFISGGVLCFLLGFFVALKANAEGMAKMIKNGEMYVKRNGRWEPRNPFRDDR